MSTPWSSSASSSTAITPSATATSEPGTAGANLRSPITTASDSTPTASVAALVSSRWRTSPQSCSKKSPPVFSTPNSFGTWPMMIVSARPTMNPFKTGSEMKPARNPSRSRPAPSARIPVVTASAAVVAAKPDWPCATSSPTVAADSAAVADIGPTTRWRELPSAA